MCLTTTKKRPTTRTSGYVVMRITSEEGIYLSLHNNEPQITLYRRGHWYESKRGPGFHVFHSLHAARSYGDRKEGLVSGFTRFGPPSHTIVKVECRDCRATGTQGRAPASVFGQRKILHEVK